MGIDRDGDRDKDVYVYIRNFIGLFNIDLGILSIY